MKILRFLGVLIFLDFFQFIKSIKRVSFFDIARLGMVKKKRIELYGVRLKK